MFLLFITSLEDFLNKFGLFFNAFFSIHADFEKRFEQRQQKAEELRLNLQEAKSNRLKELHRRVSFDKYVCAKTHGRLFHFLKKVKSVHRRILP